VRDAAPDPALADFLSRLAHDLRTPLAALQGYLALLAGEVSGPLTGRQREFLAACRTQQEELHGQLEDFLILARHLAGARMPRPEVLDLEPWLAAYAAARSRRGRRDVTIAPTAGARALADPALLRLALDHLLDDGSAGSLPEGARIAAAEAGGRVELTLANVGVPAPGAADLAVARRLLAGSGDVTLGTPERPGNLAVRLVLGAAPDRGR
jgi:signal transduction histidine kinase